MNITINTDTEFNINNLTELPRLKNHNGEFKNENQ